MGEPKWKTIDAGKLEAEISRRSSEIDTTLREAKRTDDVSLAVALHGLVATRDALTAILNSLD